jgi:hypothetical protein
MDENIVLGKRYDSYEDYEPAAELLPMGGCSVSCGGGTQLWSCTGSRKTCNRGEDFNRYTHVLLLMVACSILNPNSDGWRRDDSRNLNRNNSKWPKVITFYPRFIPHKMC